MEDSLIGINKDYSNMKNKNYTNLAGRKAIPIPKEKPTIEKRTMDAYKDDPKAGDVTKGIE